MSNRKPQEGPQPPNRTRNGDGEGQDSGPQQTKSLKVTRDARGRLVGGTPNPGGLTSAQRQARDALNLWLCDEPQLTAGKTAYLQLLKGDADNPPNPVIVKDFMDRVAGKVKERVSLEDEDGRPLGAVSSVDLVAAVLEMARKERSE